jgi:hypothetical protein
VMKLLELQMNSFNTYPTGKKMLNLEHTAGKNMQDWVEIGIDVITKFGKRNRMRRIRRLLVDMDNGHWVTK